MHRLYYSPGACSLAAHIVLEEIGIPYELELRSSFRGEGTQTPDYLAINPKGRVPALSDVKGSSGGESNLLTETPAILFFLARSHPDMALLAADPAGEARCLEWMNWLSGAVHGQAYGQLWRPGRFTVNSEETPGIVEKGRENLRAHYDYIESLLADGRDWAVPGHYSIVDAYLLVFWIWGEKIDLNMQGFPAWAALTGRILARPAVQRALAQEGTDAASLLQKSVTA
jgi:glutathione S-transferase